MIETVNSIIAGYRKIIAQENEDKKAVREMAKAYAEKQRKTKKG